MIAYNFKRLFSTLLLCSLFFLPSFLLSITNVQHVEARESKKEKKKKPKTRRSQVLGKKAFKSIERAQKFIADEQYDEADGVLSAMLLGQKYKIYEKAVAQQMMGVIAYSQNDYKKASVEFEKAISMGALPPSVELTLIFNLAQFSLLEGHNQKALSYLNRWFNEVDNITVSAYALRAQAFLALGNLKNAEMDISTALKKSTKPKQTWYSILLSIYLQQNRYKEALPVLEEAVEYFPNKKVFLQQLSAIYFELGQEDDSFSVQQIMYRQGMLKTSSELERLAQLYLYNDYPYKSAKILSDGLQNGAIEKKQSNWESLARSWMYAREWEKSRDPLLRAAKGAEDGKLYIQLGQAYLQDEDWKMAVKYLKKGIKKGGLKDKKGNAFLILGITQSKLGQYEDAIGSFRTAGDNDDLAKDAFRWIRSLERRLKERAEQEKKKAEQEKKKEG